MPEGGQAARCTQCTAVLRREGGEEGELSSRSGDSFTFAYSIQHKHTTFGEGVGNFATLDWNRPAYRRARNSALMLTFPVKCAASAVALQ